MMERTSKQRIEIIKIHYRNSESVASTLRALRPIYGRNNRPSRSTIERLVEKFQSTGTAQNVAVAVRQRSALIIMILARTPVIGQGLGRILSFGARKPEPT